MRISVQQYTLDEITANIESSYWDLQGEFQRNVSWSTRKKQRLIDTILRGWQMPSIHLLRSTDDGQLTVLDGRQRLIAIFDFMEDAFRVSRSIQPSAAITRLLGGLTYTEFSMDDRRRFDKYSIPVVVVEDSAPEEAAELYFRLNQNSRLTVAEQRNAFHGPVGRQIKDMAEEFVSLTSNQRNSGFSNLNTAYEDVLAHLANTLDEGTLWRRVSASSVTDMYKRRKPLPEPLVMALMKAIRAFSPALSYGHPFIKFSKASIYSWLLFAIRADSSKLITPNLFPLFVHDFEIARWGGAQDFHNRRFYNLSSKGQYVTLLEIFTHRCSVRINETSSLVLRDIIIWIFFSLVTKHRLDSIGQPLFLDDIAEVVELLERHKFVSEEVLLGAAETISWGDAL